ncbi:hypothetical protein Tco_1524267 [Tanacetum coccineum]
MSSPGFSELHQLEYFLQFLNSNYQDALDSAAGGISLGQNAVRRFSDIESKSKVHYPEVVLLMSRVSYRMLLFLISSPLILLSILQQIALTLEDKMTIKINQMINQRKLYTGRHPTYPPLNHAQTKTKNQTDELTFVANKAKPNLPYPSRLNKQKIREKDDILASKFMEIFRNLHFELSFADALIHMPKFAPMFKKMLNNKDKLIELTKTPLNENCSAVVLKKLPEKLGAIINLIPLSIWKKLQLSGLTETRMVLELPTVQFPKPTVIQKMFVSSSGRSSKAAFSMKLSELRDQAYENSLIYKEKTKKLHDSKIKNRIFNVGDQVLLFNSRLKIFSGKLKSRCQTATVLKHILRRGCTTIGYPGPPDFP